MKKTKMSYEEAIDYLFGLQKYGIKFGLNKTSNLLKAFGNPHHGKKYIHIAGTNGKGSVAAMAESILIKSGLKVGFYSSPHLVRFTERFRINGREMATEKAAALTEELTSIMPPKDPPTFFEVVTAMALIYFAREAVDIALIEVGMGGRLDATNVIRPLVSVITNISLEHQFFLGSRLLDIAGEKGGIIKKGVDIVTAATQPSVIKRFEALCEEKKAPFWRVGKDIRYRSNHSGFNYYGLDQDLKGLELGLSGEFQKRNATLSLGVIELLMRKGFDIYTFHIVEGIKEAFWPGRMQVVSKHPLIMLDGAHNPGAIRELARSVKENFSYQRLILVIGVMGDKDIRKMMREILPIADEVIFTRARYFRSASPERLMQEASSMGGSGEIAPLLSEAIDRAREMARPEDMILICGSLFTVGEAMSYFDPEGCKPDGL
ncbi:MAG: bifunctional folylpolyglutamate synthase/dihydrofolate synthase [Deltaproteobacteria bacterium]|nr:bifunctional folylpolyglutamate synthase/dihydrofolate synthase [Deltaproteobacteria bacterium]